MKLSFIITALVFALVMLMPFTMTDAQSKLNGIFTPEQIPRIPPNDPDIETINGQHYLRDTYNVELKDQTFSSIDNDPKFKVDRDHFKFSSNPYNATKLVPALKHEHDVKTGIIVNKKVEQYNKTVGTIEKNDVFIHALRGFEIKAKDISVFVNDPDIASVDPIVVGWPATQYSSWNFDRTSRSYAQTAITPDNIEGPTPNIQIGLIDGQILPSHPDLNLAASFCALPTGSKGCLGTVTEPWLWPTDHGTRSGGIMAARDNLAGVVGHLPGAPIYSCAYWGENSAGNAIAGNEISCLNWLISVGGIDVVHIGIQWSCSGCTAGSNAVVLPTSSQTTAINNAESAGIVVEQSAGNFGYRLAGSYKYCNIATVICTSAMHDNDGKCGGLGANFGPFNFQGRTGLTQVDDQRAYFSNYGPDVDIMSQGGNVFGAKQSLSTSQPPSATIPTTTGSISQAFPYIGASIHGYYGTFGGTSEAGPHVAGAIAAIKYVNPTFTPTQIRTDLITDTSISLSATCNSATGIGGLDNRNLVWSATTGSSEPLLDLSKLD